LNLGSVIEAPVGVVGASTDRRGSRMIGRRGAVRALLVAAVGSLLVVQSLHPAGLVAPNLRAGIETACALGGLVIASMLQVEFGRTGRLRDLALFGAVVALVLHELSVNGLPTMLGLRHSGPFAAASDTGEVLVGAMFAVGASIPRGIQVARRGWAEVLIVILALAAAGFAQLYGALLHDSNGAIMSSLEFAASCLFAYSAFALIRRDAPPRKAQLLACAMGLMALTSLYGLFGPAQAPDTVSGSDALRLLAFGLLVAAWFCQELEARRTLASVAAIAERQRVARDLHDGLAQDLAFIAAHGARLTGPSGEEHPLAIAAKRALAISRATICDLSSEHGTTVRQALQAVAHELGTRFEIEIDVDVPAAIDVPAEALEDGVRIVREAIANAARHGGAEHVLVTLRRTELGIVLQVRDDGCGFAGSGNPSLSDGFGLRSIRERAVALGGELVLRQPGSGGIELEVLVP
jgi:signal transduction histidine kinase